MSYAITKAMKLKRVGAKVFAVSPEGDEEKISLLEALLIENETSSGKCQWQPTDNDRYWPGCFGTQEQRTGELPMFTGQYTPGTHPMNCCPCCGDFIELPERTYGQSKQGVGE